jgi:prepilin-type N-terminal cleavage/methylation domain-containing protein
MGQNKSKFNRSGFSLLELSITLVIVGLATAAITSGTHLMQAAKLNNIIAEISGYVKATNSFKDKYKGCLAIFQMRRAIGELIIPVPTLMAQ